VFQVENDTNGSNRLLFDELFGLGSSDSVDAEDEVSKNCSCREYRKVTRAFENRNSTTYLQK
jgi:hypothetical protein